MLDKLLGNAQTRQDLAAALKAGRLANSVLLVGEEGCGTGFAARCLAADYLYPQGGDGAANVMAGRCPECLELWGEGASGQIKIQQIRQVRRRIADTALSAQGRVVILFQAQRMNQASANALLKSLEEPPPQVLFILTAPGQAGLMATILSRCGVYHLSPIPQEDCAKALLAAGKEVTPARARELSLIYGGKLGRCLDALEGDRQAALAMAGQLADLVAQRNEYAAQCLVSPLEKDKPGQLLLLETLASLALATLHQPGLTDLRPAQCTNLITQAGDSIKALEANGNSRLILTTFIARLF